jgi:hypothetical protein
MLRLVLLTLALIATPAQAQMASTSDIAAEAVHYDLPGPRDGETRTVHVWRPPGVEGPLPVLYVGDGSAALLMSVAGVRAAISDGRIRPFMVVSLENARGDLRRREYALASGDNRDWERHFDWFVNIVMPWAELRLGASPDPEQRALGGVSNSADWALAAAARRPDLFHRVLAHSPVNDVLEPFAETPSGRWGVTAGSWTRDQYARNVATGIVRALDGRPVRTCFGAWGHDARGWREISPGSIVWLLELGDVTSVETDTEREECHQQ